MFSKRKSVLSLLVFLGVINLLAWLAVYNLGCSHSLEVTFFDVGQGDSIFIETAKRNQILIDGGPSPVILEKLARVMPFWDKTIDLIILTHLDSDHLFGLLKVLEKYQVENILWTGTVKESGEYYQWQRLLAEEGAEELIAQAGLKVYLASSDDKYLEVLYPFDNLLAQGTKDSNDTSIVTRLVFLEQSFLFTGDISEVVERELIKNEINLNSTVLKVAHHGSRRATSESFLEVVLPEKAVISLGKDNRYGHPHQETLERLEKYGIEIIRTDQVGDIKIITNGQKLIY